MASQNDNSENDALAAPNELGELYVKLLQDYHSDTSLTYDKIAGDITRNPKLGVQYDREVIEQALKVELLPARLAGALVQSPYVQHQLRADDRQVSEYLAGLQASYASASKPRQQNTANEQRISERPKLGQTTVTPNSQLESVTEIAAPTSSREAEDYALSLVQMLDQRRINTDRLSINVNGKTVFKMRDGDIDPAKTAINSEHTELIKKALNDPASFNGSVKITQGNQVLLHVSDGRVLVDAVGLSKQSAKVEVKVPDSPTHALYERFSQGVNGNGWQATKSIASNALKAGIERQQILQMLRERDPNYRKLATSQGEKASDRILEKIVNLNQVELARQNDRQELKQEKIARSVKV
ncbi:hypothetical protein B7486_42415 [cyanobacterium TDX16]|nr:hypothetical protein B7486_42415 [cyanobacterium TDX16]